jgi:hypothetical protein
MKTILKITADLLDQINQDLQRPHPFAFERVGFILCRPARLEPEGWILLAWGYHTVADDDYVDDYSVGAMMGPGAIRKALQLAFNDPLSIVHVHLHDHSGKPGFSKTDAEESARFVPDFWNVRPSLPHGAIVLSRDSAYGFVWEPTRRRRVPLDETSIVGAPMRLIRER